MISRTKIIIIGGGFAGVKCAKTLCRKLQPDRYEIVLFNRENHMVFHPLLAEVAGASINPDAVVAPLRQMLPHVSCRTEAVQKIDLEHKFIEYESHDGPIHQMTYDHVVLACGGEVNLGMVPGMADHAFPLKTIGDAMALRAHVMQQLEKAEVCDDPERKRWYLSFIVVGGGFSGVEAAGEINDLVRGSLRFFQHIGTHDITVTIIHSRDQLLPEIGPTLREFARDRMERAGIKVVLNVRVALATAEGVGLKNGGMIRGATVICTIGTAMSPVIARLGGPKEGGRLITEADMRLPGYDNVWAVGDCARILNAYDNEACPPTGQFAERQGRQAAENIVRVLHGQPTCAFLFKPLGQLCAIGGRTAVAEFLGVRMSGFLAWFFWRTVYLFKLPSWSRRIKVGFDWAWELVFWRDLAHLKTDQSKRVGSAHYASGDYIFRQGDPGTSFYVIEKGEVEVLRHAPTTNSDEALSVLGPGEFFGEMALIENRSRSASVRARTPVEVVVMGKNAFSQISTALKPLRDLLARTIMRRSRSVWQRWPAAHKILSVEPLSAFIETLPGFHLRPESTLEHAMTSFEKTPSSFLCILDERHSLQGILTRTDIFRASELGANRHTPVRDFMVPAITVTRSDTSLMAAALLRDHELKSVPVIESENDRRIVGYVRAERMFMHVLQKLPAEFQT
jgi:NADH:quinone reductase (non-electrogenic)